MNIIRKEAIDYFSDRKRNTDVSIDDLVIGAKFYYYHKNTKFLFTIEIISEIQKIGYRCYICYINRKSETSDFYCKLHKPQQCLYLSELYNSVSNKYYRTKEEALQNGTHNY